MESQHNKHSVHPPPPTLSEGEEEVEPPTKFSKRGGLTRPQLLGWGCWERWGGFFQGGGGGGLQFSHKLKSEMFNDRKSL